MKSILQIPSASALVIYAALLILPAASISATPLTQDELQQTLDNFVNQGEKQVYKGTFVYLFGDGLQTFNVLRKKDQQGLIHESFIPLDNDSSESHRLLKNHYCLLDNDWKYQFQAFSSSFPFRINNNYAYLSRNYRIEPIRMERVAGLATQHVSFLPRDQFRYGYELWFEPETGVLLKYQLINDRNETIEQYLFSNILLEKHHVSGNEINAPAPDKSQIPQCSALRPENIKLLDQLVDRKQLPDGFQLISYRQNQLQNSPKVTEQLHLSDGLAAVSVFIETLDDTSNAMQGIAKIGPLTLAGKTTQDYQVIVVGAIPVDGAVRILDSIKNKK